MPLAGETCTKLGTYKNTCCDVELVIAGGAKFPGCVKHPDQPTEWRLLPELQRIKKLGSKTKK